MSRPSVVFKWLLLQRLIIAMSFSAESSTREFSYFGSRAHGLSKTTYRSSGLFFTASQAPKAVRRCRISGQPLKSIWRLHVAQRPGISPYSFEGGFDLAFFILILFVKVIQTGQRIFSFGVSLDCPLL